jgi:hypothetical protein
MEGSVATLFAFFVEQAQQVGLGVLVAGLERYPEWRDAVEVALRTSAAGENVRFFDTLDGALLWCEESILAAAGQADSAGEEVPLEKQPLLARLSGEQIEAMRAICERRVFESGQRIVSQGERSDEVFLIASGRVAVSVGLADDRRHRVATIGTGMTVGELALLDEQARSADVDADGPVTVYVFRARDLTGVNGNTVRASLIELLAGDLADRLRRANAEIAALAT